MKRKLKIVICLAVVLVVCGFILSSLGVEDKYTGVFIKANKVYMPNNNIKLVLYFNDTVVDNTKFVIFDDWDAKHSIQLSNMAGGTEITIHYKEYLLGGGREIVRIELL